MGGGAERGGGLAVIRIDVGHELQEINDYQHSLSGRANTIMKNDGKEEKII